MDTATANHLRAPDRKPVHWDRRAADVMQARRITLGLTQPQLAALAGVSAGHVKAIEQGERSPSYDILCRLAKALQLRAYLTPVALVPIEAARLTDKRGKRSSATPHPDLLPAAADAS